MSQTEAQLSDPSAANGESVAWTDSYTDDQFARDKALFSEVYGYEGADRDPQLDPDIEPSYLALDPQHVYEMRLSQIANRPENRWRGPGHEGESIAEFRERKDDIFAEGEAAAVRSMRGYARRLIRGLSDARSDNEALSSALEAASSFESNADRHTVLRGTTDVEEVSVALQRLGRVGDAALKRSAGVRAEHRNAASRYVAALTTDSMEDRVGETDLLRVFEAGVRNSSAAVSMLETQAQRFNAVMPNMQIDLDDLEASRESFTDPDEPEVEELEEPIPVLNESKKQVLIAWTTRLHLPHPDTIDDFQADIGGNGERYIPVQTAEEFEDTFGFAPTDLELEVAGNPSQLTELTDDQGIALFGRFNDAAQKIVALRYSFEEKDGSVEDLNEFIDSPFGDINATELSIAMTREARQAAADQLGLRMQFLAAALSEYIPAKIAANKARAAKGGKNIKSKMAASNTSWHNRGAIVTEQTGLKVAT